MKYDHSDAPLQRVVNVASVPMRSPFRYPGGKTWLVPTVRRWLESLPTRPAELVEPFCGGAIIGLSALFDGQVDTVTLVELDEDVAAVWTTILNGRGEWLADAIAALELSPDVVRRVLEEASRSVHARALATIVRNRIARGGILAPGAGVVKNGENGKGLLSRWYPETLRKRILDIAARRDRIRFVAGDGLEYLSTRSGSENAVYFIDPPYTVAGRRLYTHSTLDHERLFGIAATLAGDFLMTYDDGAEIRRLARKSGFETRLIPMKSTHHVTTMELLIGRDLTWVPLF